MYNTPNQNNMAPWLTKRLRENEIGKGYLRSTGKMNVWDFPEFDVARNDMAMERDIGLSDLTRRLSGAGVEGPAAALSMEKAGNTYSNSLLNLANKLRGSFIERGLNIGGQSLDQANKEKQMGLQWQQGHDQRRAQPNDFMKTVQGVNAATGAISNIAELGLGGAGMLGMLPGMNGVSSLAGGQGGLNIQQLIQMLTKLLPAGG